jgi:hypothetical protein
MLSLALLLMLAPVQEAPVLTSGSVVEAAARLRPGQYLGRRKSLRAARWS